MMMTIDQAVRRDPEVMSGELCFAETRVPVENLFGYLQGGSDLDEFFLDFPGVTHEQVKAVLRASFEELDRHQQARSA